MDAKRTSVLLFTIGLLGGAIAFGAGLMLNLSQPDSPPVLHAATTAPAHANQSAPPGNGPLPDRLAQKPDAASRVSAMPATIKAAGDWCDGAMRPSSRVICADPELRAVADQRNRIYQSLRHRLGPAQRLVLQANQDQWLRDYATACGVPPEVPPQLPPSSAVRACFKQAGLARNEFLRKIAPATFSVASPIAQPDIIPFVQANGVDYVAVAVNGLAPIPFILDSGASDITLPADVFRTLVRMGAITDSDINGPRTYTLANGSTVTSYSFYIRSLKVGSFTIFNVEASITNASATPLLGQSVLARFGSWSIDNAHHALILRPDAG